MLISIWWVVAAFILGGTGGVLALAVFSAMPGRDEVETAQFEGFSQTR